MILQTKLFIPHTHTPLVERPRLTESIAAGKNRKLILICAPAGFGKTSLVYQWIQQENPCIAWYALDEEDSKPERFFRYFIAALQTLDDQLNTALMPFVQSQTIPPPERLIPLLINHLVSLPTDSYVVLDDYHLIQPDTSPVHEAIRLLLQHIPPQFHLIILTRRDVPFSIGRLRVNNEMTEIRGTDLRFTEAETGQFFKEMHNMPLSPAQVHTFHERTEGWVACLQLARLSLRDQADLDRLANNFTGIHRPIAEYLLEEVFCEQSPTVQEFLLKTSVLKRLHVELCQELTECDDAAGILEYLKRTNLFVFTLDAKCCWFRYHQLLSEFLEHRLRHTDQDLWSALHTKAAVWFADHGEFDDAHRHAFASGDLEFAADLLEHYSGAIFRKCHFVVFRQWFGQLPEELIKPRVLLRVNRMVIAVHQEDFTHLEEWLTDLEQAFSQNDWSRYSETEIQQMQGLIIAFRLYYRQIRQEYEQVMQNAEHLLQTLAPDLYVVRGIIQTVRALTLIEQGDMLAAMPPLQDGFKAMSAAKLGYSAVNILQLQARVEKAQGHLRRAETILHDALLWVKKADFMPLVVTVTLHTAIAELFYEQNQLALAREHVEQGIEYAEAVTVWGFLASGYWIKASICQALGQIDDAWRLAQKAVTIAHQTGGANRIRLAEAYAVNVALRQGNMEYAQQWLVRRQISLEEPFSKTFEQECLTLASVYLAQQQYREMMPLLTTLRSQTQTRNCCEAVMRIDILQAAALHGEGKYDEARAMLEHAIVSARPEGYVRIFADQAIWIVELLLALQHSQNKLVRASVPVLLDACGIASTPPSAQIRINEFDYLTPREVEILRLLMSGASNEQIADQTFVALSTVKSHIKHIYSKLGVKNRTQAILKAKTLLSE